MSTATNGEYTHYNSILSLQTAYQIVPWANQIVPFLIFVCCICDTIGRQDPVIYPIIEDYHGCHWCQLLFLDCYSEISASVSH